MPAVPKDGCEVIEASSLQPTVSSEWSLTAIATVGIVAACHFGLRLAGYNRINAFGIRRKRIKRIEKWMFLETWLTPILIGWFAKQPLLAYLHGQIAYSELPVGLRCYALLCLVIGLTLGLLWLVWRPVFGVQRIQCRRSLQIENVEELVERPLARTRKCRIMSRVPLNQMFDLAIEQVEIPVVGLPRGLDGYRIAHLSDIHLTGQVEPCYVRHVLDRTIASNSDLIALTGDIVDTEACIGWLYDLFSPVCAADGCHFILGNHDTRVSQPDRVREAMTQAGWNDLGGKCHATTLRGSRVTLIGNEWPWFSRPSDAEMGSLSSGFRIGLSHSPDQFDWARRHEIGLLLCGHTHGGQGRIPLAGPILSPSLHGSRWASGDFFRSPTSMHVSRGLGGVHLLRIHCRPELCLLTLRSA